MGKTIDLASYKREYNKMIEEIIQELENFEDSLFDNSLGLLIAGKWSDWSEKQPIGTVFNFNEKEMLEADDPIVNELLELKELLKEKKERILKNTNHN